MLVKKKFDLFIIFCLLLLISLIVLNTVKESKELSYVETQRPNFSSVSKEMKSVLNQKFLKKNIESFGIKVMRELSEGNILSINKAHNGILKKVNIKLDQTGKFRVLGFRQYDSQWVPCNDKKLDKGSGNENEIALLAQISTQKNLDCQSLKVISLSL